MKEIESHDIEYLDKQLSKRAARRIIQRAFVLMGRAKPVRQHIRESELITLWIIEDWDLEWTVYLKRGKFEVERRPAKRPDVTLTWPTAEGFFAEVEGSGDGTEGVQMTPATGHQRFFQPLLRGFFENLRHVLANPVDDVGDPLV
jgi:hypothetical protein